MKFFKGFSIFWIVYILFFVIGLPLILHYVGGHEQNDYQLANTSASEEFVLLGVGSTLWLVVFIYYVKKFLINLLLKKNPFIRLMEHGELDRELIAMEVQGMKWNTKAIFLILLGLISLIALPAGLLVYSYIHESRGMIVID